MEAPIPKGEKHLPMETFTLVAPEMDPSHPGSTQEGPQAPCTNRVYKAAHRRSSKATVSHLTVRPYLLVIANPPGTIPIGFQQFCDFLVQSSPTPKPRQRMSILGFSCKGLNKLAHALNGNYISWPIPTPHFRSKEWKHSFSLSTGMIVFRYAFYGKDKLWLKYYRRGQSYEVDTSRPSSPRLYGTMLRSVASFGGGPGSRWTYFQRFKPYWPRLSDSTDSPSSAQNIYHWNHLRYAGSGPDDIYISDVDDEYDDAGLSDQHLDQDCAIGVPCGYQDRRALRGSHRGTRSEASRTRRFTSWKQKQKDSRQDFRIWKSSYKDSTLRTHGDQNPKPLTCPKSTAQIRLQSQASSFANNANQLRNSCKSVAAPLPTGFDIHIATWNVEGLREVAKYDQILSFLRHRNIHLLAVQETKSDSISTFNKSGWEILHSGASNAKHHGVGFFVSPSLRPHVHSYLAHSPRICEITVRTNPHPITVFSIYAPSTSTVEDSSEDVARKEFFWSQLDGIITDHKNSSHVVILGDFNSRLDSFIDPDQDHIGSHVWGKRRSIEDTERDNALYLLDFMQSHLLLLPQTFVDVPNARKVSYKEMTSTTDVLEDFEVTDWTTLDYCATSHPIFPDISFKGSIFQQLVNTRHLPLLFTYRSTCSARLPIQTEPKLDYSRTSQFYEALEADL